MLILNNLTWLYHCSPMRFSLQIEAGERIAVLGPSGAGKSTLLNLIAGFLPASAGHLSWHGQDITHSHPSQRPISMLFQHNNLFPHLTVRQNIALGIDPGLRLNQDQRQQLEEITHQMGLSAMQKRLPGQLSGGQQQRVALARCLVRQQPILLLDEPFSALDPALRNEMLILVKNACESRGITLLMVSHNLEDARQIAARGITIIDGQVAWQGSTEALITGKIPQAHVPGIVIS